MQEFLGEKKVEGFEIAMAYVPWQDFERLFEDLDKAYHMGTIFPELCKPFSGRRCCR